MLKCVFIADCTGSITAKGDILIKIEKTRKKMISTVVDAIQLSIFSHRFMSLAEQMGRYMLFCSQSVSSNCPELCCTFIHVAFRPCNYKMYEYILSKFKFILTMLI